MAKFVQLLLLFCLSDVGVISPLSFGVFNRCPPVPADKKSPEIYSEGEKIQLCCHINPKFCNGKMYIYHSPFEKQNQILVMESEKCTDTLQIPEAKTWNNGSYTCSVSNNTIGVKEVYVVGKPTSSMRILNKKIILKHKRTSFIITFDPGDMTVFDNITVYGGYFFKTSGRDLWCKNSSLLCSTNKICTCKYNNGMLKDRNITLVIVKTRLNNSIEVKDSFNPYLFIQPKHVVKLEAFDITSSSAKIMWCWHPQMMAIIPYMSLRNAAYGYKFQMLKLQGAWQKRAATISSPHQGNIGEDKCIVVEVQHLTPFTRYDVKINAITSQSRSRATKTIFTTKGDAPRIPPQEILFWAVDDHESQSQKSVALFLIWKPIPHDDRGGPIFYDVEIFCDNSELSHQYNVNTSHTIVRNIPLDKDLVIKIWAVNNISRSLNFSELRLPHYGIVRDSAGLDSHVDLQKENAVTYVKLPPGWEVSGVHWCPGHLYQQMDKLVICDEFPLVDKSVHKYSEQDTGILKYTVNLRQNTSISNDTVWEENMVVKGYRNPRRSSRPKTQQIKVTVKESHRHISPTLHEWNGRRLKFLLSFKKDGNHMSQLFPFNCYYNSSKGEVKLLPRTDSEDDETFLVLEQECDFVNPSQYLVEEYKVLLASSNQCKSVKGRTTVSLKNNIFDQNKIRLSQLPTFACITSEGSRNQKAHDVHYIQESRDGFDITILWTVLSIIASVILPLILCAGCLCYYRKRYRNLRKGSNVTGTTLTRIADDTDQAENLMFTEADTVSYISEYFEKDSGFTASSQVSRTFSDTSRPFSELHKSDSVDNFIVGPAKCAKNRVADEICLEKVESETNLSQEQGESITEANESEDDNEALGISAGQASASESHSLLMEDLANQLRQKCPE